MDTHDQATFQMQLRREQNDARMASFHKAQAAAWSREARGLHLFHVVIPQLKADLLAAQKELDACGYIKSLDFGD